MCPEMLGIGESCVYVDDVDAAEDWYNEVLELETAFGGEHYRFLNTVDAGEPRQQVILFDPSYTEDQSATPPHGTRDDVHLALDVPLSTLDDWRDHLNEYGVSIEDEKSRGDIHSLYFRDPYNNSLELYGVDM